MTDRWRPLDADAVGPWAELMNLLAVVDATEEFYEAEDLAEELTEVGVNPELDTVGVWRHGALVAFGQVRVFDGLSGGRVRADLDAGVHPDVRGQGIGRALMDRLEARAVELSAKRHPGVAVRLGASGGQDGDAVRRLLEHRGYHAARYFQAMRRALPGAELPPPEHPVQPYRDQYCEALRLAHNDAFATHFGSVPISRAEWGDWVRSRVFRPECTSILVDSDVVLAYTVAYQYVPGELYLPRVGTVQHARGRGYARSCLVGALRAAAVQGFTQVDLHVDSLNPTGAGRLYETVGFAHTRTVAAYDKVVPAAG